MAPVEDDVTDEDGGVEEPMSAEDRKKRKKQLEDEIAQLDADDRDKIDEDVEDVADRLANEDKPDLDLQDDADDAAQAVADQIKSRKGITLTDDEVDGIAKRIAKRTREVEGETDTDTDSDTAGGDSDEDSKPAAGGRTRQPDRRPKATHWTERRLFGRDKR